MRGFFGRLIRNASEAASARMVLAGVALGGFGVTGWQSLHTVLDPETSTRVAERVLESEEVRGVVAGVVSAVVVDRVPQLAGTDPAVLRTSVESSLADPVVADALTRFVAGAHGRLLGEGEGPVVLDRAAVDVVLTGAGLDAATIAQVPAVSIPVPEAGPLASANADLPGRVQFAAIAAPILLVLGVAMSNDRPMRLRRVGTWLGGIGGANLVVLYLVPVHLAPGLSSSPWAGLVAGVAREAGSQVVPLTAALAAAGVVVRAVAKALPAPEGDGEPTVDESAGVELTGSIATS